jgi:leucyl/phenylalanyl-tRNA--protein transferase
MSNKESRQPERLDPEIVLAAYRLGLFPMAESRTGPVSWYSPDPRAIIPLDAFNLPRSLKRTIRKGIFSVCLDTAFAEVIRLCAHRDETWISEEIERTYVELFAKGYAHSVESWQGALLAGGLYGIAVGGAFFGESMFSLRPDASKVALAFLVDFLRARGYALLDVQFMNEHLRQFGTREIPRQEYLARLGDAVRRDVRFLPA